MRVKPFTIPPWWCVRLHGDLIPDGMKDGWQQYQVGKAKAYVQVQIRIPYILVRLFWKAREWQLKQLRKSESQSY